MCTDLFLWSYVVLKLATFTLHYLRIIVRVAVLSRRRRIQFKWKEYHRKAKVDDMKEKNNLPNPK